MYSLKYITFTKTNQVQTLLDSTVYVRPMTVDIVLVDDFKKFAIYQFPANKNRISF